MPPKITEKQKVVIDYILGKIKTAELKSGDKLDTESNIAKEIGFTRTTVREATRNLVENKAIYKVNGSGLYVGSGLSNKPSSFHELSPFNDQAKKSGQEGKRLLISSCIIQVPSVQIAHSLRIKPTENVYYIERLMSFGFMPVAFERIHIPVSLFPNFQFNEVEFSKYQYLEKLTGKNVHTREQDIAAFNLVNEKVAGLLKVDVGQAMIELQEVVYLDDRTPVEFTVATINSDLFNIHQITSRVK